ncbi:hypothetical protein BJX96DRAFT_70699 [Aspergillus floccosus]
MTDYSKWKVTDLKAELKRRGIAQTGLRVKQQFIDRLVEDDTKGEPEATNVEPEPVQEPVQEASQPAESEPPVEEPAPVATPQIQEQKPTEPTHTQEQSEQQVQNGTSVAPEQESAQPAEPKPSTEGAKGEADIAQAIESGDKQVPSVTQPQTDAATQPDEQAPDAAAQEATHVGTESTKPLETTPTDKNIALAPKSDVNTGLSTPLPPEEMLEDQKKRKRRSQSPVPTVEAIANKKIKAQDEAPKIVLEEDKGEMEVDGNARQEASIQGPSEEQPAQKPQEAGMSDESKARKEHPSKQDVRFKELFAANEPGQPRPVSPPPDVDMGAEVEPAQHVATPALYVDGLMRPLQPAALRHHLVSLACPPGDSPNPEVILDFYMDPIKTHCFVSFINVSAASRVRAALHNTVWPNERNRKSLFVDFIPEGKVPEWVDKEETARKRGGPPPRFEVKYDRTDDGVEAILQEVGARSASGRAPEASEFSRPPPLGPRADIAPKDRRPSHQPAPASERPAQSGQGFKPLDDLFMSTTTKPKLYYLPVPRSVADRRLDRFDDLLRKGSFPRRGGDELRRIAFEDDDLFVDNGPDFGSRRRGGGGRGRGRGGFGDSWRDDRRGRH